MRLITAEPERAARLLAAGQAAARAGPSGSSSGGAALLEAAQSAAARRVDTVHTGPLVLHAFRWSARPCRQQLEHACA